MSEPAATRYAPHLWMTAMIAIWGASYSVVKVALDVMPALTVVALRFWIAVVCMLPFVGRGILAELRATRTAGLVAGTALLLGYELQMLGLQETSAATGGFLSGLIVLLAGLGGFVFFRARFGPLSVAGFVLGLVGMSLLCWPVEAGADGVRDTPRGIALQIGSSTAYAAHILLLSRFGRGAPALALCLWQMLVTAVGSTALAFATGDLGGATFAAIDWSLGLVLALFYLGAFANALSVAVQGRVQHRIPPVHVALLFTTQPLFAALFAWWWRGDQIGPWQAGGGLLIVGAMLLTGLDRR